MKHSMKLHQLGARKGPIRRRKKRGVWQKK
jgi:hypothetical protein